MAQLICGDEEDLKKFVKATQKDNRYYGINFCNLGKEKNTIEFRLSNGTVDAETWIENINLFGGIIKASEDLAIIQTKPEEERTYEEKEKLDTFSMLKESEASNEEKLELLLSIVIPEKDRDVYRARYRVNNQLIEEKTEIKDEISKKIAKSSIDIKMIGKKIFSGEERVTGQDYNKGRNIIEMDLRSNMNDLQKNSKDKSIE